MPTNHPGSCATCKFYAPLHLKNLRQGQCHLKPPVLRQESKHEQWWDRPAVLSGDGACYWHVSKERVGDFSSSAPADKPPTTSRTGKEVV